MTQSVNFVGLGVMGLPMAINLRRSGYAVCAYSRSEQSRVRGRAQGLDVVDSADALPNAPDFFVTVVPDSPDVQAVLFEPGGAAARTASSTLFVDMSTIAPDAARQIGVRLAATGHGFLDAPVSGGEAGAVNAQLSIMVGGKTEDYAKAADLFAALGTTIVHVGSAGAGQVVKAANQMIVAGNLAILAEALVFIACNDIEPSAALRVIAGGLAGSTVIDRKSSAMVSGDFTPGFRLTLHDKDLGIVRHSAEELGIRLRVTELVSEIVHQMVTGGRGGLDHSALYLIADEVARTPAAIVSGSS